MLIIGDVSRIYDVGTGFTIELDNTNVLLFVPAEVAQENLHLLQTHTDVCLCIKEGVEVAWITPSPLPAFIEDVLPDEGWNNFVL